MKEIRSEQWITWIGGIIIAVGSCLVFFYSTFETRASVEQYKEYQDSFRQELIRRLDRIEQKLDAKDRAP